MFICKLFNTRIMHCPGLFSVTKRLLHNKSDAIVIASAVRTPWGKFQGQLASVNAGELGRLTVETAVKQSSVPLEDVKQIIMAETPFLQKENDTIFSDFLKKTKYTAIKSEKEVTVVPILKALDLLKSEPETVVVVGGMESATQRETLLGHQIEIPKANMHLFANISFENVANYITCSKAKFLKAQKEAIFLAELFTLNVKYLDGKRRLMREVKEDETHCVNYRDQIPLQYSDGASAVVLTTWYKAQELNLSPLAQIIEYECLKNSETILKTARQCIETLFAKNQIALNSIQHWEIDDYIPQLVVYLKDYFNINMELVNPHGSSIVMGYSPAASFPRHLTHMAHALMPQKYGCIISSTSQKTLGLLIEKLPSTSHSERLPLLTLYTKDPCLLCDTLVEELESKFSGEYELEKVFIDTKENVRYLRLFRWDIPVLFLNNQFLCMHRLNHELLRKKLDLLKEQ